MSSIRVGWYSFPDSMQACWGPVERKEACRSVVGSCGTASVSFTTPAHAITAETAARARPTCGVRRISAETKQVWCASRRHSNITPIVSHISTEFSAASVVFTLMPRSKCRTCSLLYMYTNIQRWNEKTYTSRIVTEIHKRSGISCNARYLELVEMPKSYPNHTLIRRWTISVKCIKSL